MLRFKNERDKELFFSLHPILIMIYADLFYYTKDKYNIELVITDTVSTLEKDVSLGRISPAHREHRAIDIRTRDIDAFVVQDIINYINNKDSYDEFKYVSRSGIRRLAYYHTHRGEHIHLAIHSKFKKDR